MLSGEFIGGCLPVAGKSTVNLALGSEAHRARPFTHDRQGRYRQ